MQGLTLIIAVIACLIVFLTKPVWSLVVYCAVIAWYPLYLTVPVGTIDFTAPRILILIIFANLFLRTDLAANFKFLWVDRLIIIYFLCQFLAGAATIPFNQLVENRMGAIFDLVLPYFAVRMIITKKEQYFILLKSILAIVAPLALVAFYESLTGHNPAAFLRVHYTWGSTSSVPNPRSGFFRACLVFPSSIILGLFFAITGALCSSLLRDLKGNKFAFGVWLAALGVFSSMSSGPWYGALLAIIFIAFFPYRKNWKMACITIVLMCLLVEVISNRHFYEVIDRVAFNSGTAWYRTKLIKVALFEGGMSGHWLTGFGFQDPGWGPRIDTRTITDLANHYIAILSRYGLVGLLPFLAVTGTAMKRLVDAYRRSSANSNQWLVWCLAGTMFGVLGAAHSSMLNGPARILFYILLGLCAAMPTIVGQVNPKLAYIR